MIPDFIPKHRLIVNATNAVNTEITTELPHGYYTSQVVRINVPDVYGMVINAKQAVIVVTGLNTFIAAIDTSCLKPFVAPVFIPNRPGFTQAQVTPITGVEMNIAPY